MKIEKIVTILEKEFRIKLEKKGSNIFFLCPFHEDKNPSLSFETKRMFFKCFGCHFKARNIYDFWSSYKNLNIEETLKEMYSLGYIKSFSQRKILIEENSGYKKVLNAFSDLYVNNLLTLEGKSVLRYLIDRRKISKETLKDFRIGTSVNPKQLVTILQRKENEELAKLSAELNIIMTRGEDDFDFFWKNQVVIPIENEESDVVLIASRKISDGDNKYIFLPSTIVCEKSSTIYNYKRAVRSKEDFCYLVEGFFDVLSLHENGIKNCVSCLGTSVSNQQLKMIEKLKKKILIFFDGDRAGIEGSIIVSSNLMKKGIDCEIIETTIGKDPDEIYREEKNKDKVIQRRTNPFSFSISYYYEKFEVKNNPQRSKQLIKKLSELFYWSKENVRKFLAEKISNILNLSYEEVWKTMSSEMEEAEGFEPSRVF